PLFSTAPLASELYTLSLHDALPILVVLDQLFADQDGVFEVVTAPGHEGYEHVAAKSKFAAFRARTIGKNLALLHTVADANQRLRSEEHTSELQSRGHLVCRLLLEKK